MLASMSRALQQTTLLTAAEAEVHIMLCCDQSPHKENVKTKLQTHTHDRLAECRLAIRGAPCWGARAHQLQHTEGKASETPVRQGKARSQPDWQ